MEVFEKHGRRKRNLMAELELGAKQELFNRLDECLRKRAAEYMEPRDENGLPFIRNIYYLQGLTEVHTYLKTVHEFRPGRGQRPSDVRGPAASGASLLGGKRR